MPCADATAFPSSTSALTSARRSGRSQTRPCVRPVSAPTGFVAELKITLRHWAGRASATAAVGIPPRVHASASSSISSARAGCGSNGPERRVALHVPLHDARLEDLPGRERRPADDPADVRATTSSLPTPFCTVATAPSANACAVAAIAPFVCIAFVATIPKSHGGSDAGVRRRRRAADDLAGARRAGARSR